MDATLLFGLLYMRWTYDQIRINREDDPNTDESISTKKKIHGNYLDISENI